METSIHRAFEVLRLPLDSNISDVHTRCKELRERYKKANHGNGKSSLKEVYRAYEILQKFFDKGQNNSISLSSRSRANRNLDRAINNLEKVYGRGVTTSDLHHVISDHQRTDEFDSLMFMSSTFSGPIKEIESIDKKDIKIKNENENCKNSNSAHIPSFANPEIVMQRTRLSLSVQSKYQKVAQSLMKFLGPCFRDHRFDNMDLIHVMEYVACAPHAPHTAEKYFSYENDCPYNHGDYFSNGGSGVSEISGIFSGKDNRRASVGILDIFEWTRANRSHRLFGELLLRKTGSRFTRETDNVSEIHSSIDFRNNGNSLQPSDVFNRISLFDIWEEIIVTRNSLFTTDLVKWGAVCQKIIRNLLRNQLTWRCLQDTELLRELAVKEIPTYFNPLFPEKEGEYDMDGLELSSEELEEFYDDEDPISFSETKLNKLNKRIRGQVDENELTSNRCQPFFQNNNNNKIIEHHDITNCEDSHSNSKVIDSIIPTVYPRYSKYVEQDPETLVRRLRSEFLRTIRVLVGIFNLQPGRISEAKEVMTALWENLDCFSREQQESARKLNQTFHEKKSDDRVKRTKADNSSEQNSSSFIENCNIGSDMTGVNSRLTYSSGGDIWSLRHI